MTLQADIAFIGGSSTNSISFPENLDRPDVELLDRGTRYHTPHGLSPQVGMFALGGRRVLSVRMHGWHPEVSRGQSSLQIFSVFARAGVRTVVSEGGVGGVNEDLRPRDIVLPDDYIDLSMRKDVSLGMGYLLIMRDPVCPVLSGAAHRTLQDSLLDVRVRKGGVYACTDGHHFESRAEVRMIAGFGADVVGQSLCPEVYLAREIGACYLSVQQVVNAAEGVGGDWSHDELADIFHGRARDFGRAMLAVIESIPEDRDCSCASLRKKTLIRPSP